MSSETSYIAPDYLYTLSGFMAATGISVTRRHEAKKLGIHLDTLDVGKRKFVLGRAVIDYVIRLAAAEKGQTVDPSNN